MVLDLWKIGLFVNNITFKKQEQKIKKNKIKKKHESINNLWRILGIKLLLLVDSETTFPKQFSLNLFSTLKSRMSTNRCKSPHKLCKGQNIPPLKSEFEEIIFYKVIFPQI